jgi:hypothetical protein
VKAIAAASGSLLLAACATEPNLYSWGRYEGSIYGAYLAPQNSPPERQVAALELDYQNARAANQRLPPGWHAHLGYLYSELGKFEEATAELQAEKASFPEATVFVDHLLANLVKR